MNINLIVRSVAVDSVDVSTVGGYQDVVPGRVSVEFDGGGVNFEIDWTHRGDPPTPGSKWTLRSEDPK